MYRIRILDEATSDLARLDKSVNRRIVDRINMKFFKTSKPS
jgi:mRNA-degrading endonuclease RelE of RelBE toxin-antitoxin system